MKGERADLRSFATVVRRILANNDMSISTFGEISNKHGLKNGSLSRYIYSINAPSVSQLWRLSRALSEVNDQDAVDVFLSLAKTLEHIDT